MSMKEDVLGVLAGEGDNEAKAAAIMDLLDTQDEMDEPEEPIEAEEPAQADVETPAVTDRAETEAQGGADTPKEEKKNAPLFRNWLGRGKFEQEEINQVRIQAAIDVAVAKARVRNEKTEEIVKRCIDVSAVKVDDDGNVTGVAEQIKALREDEQTAYLFRHNTKPRQRYEPAAGKDPAPVSYGKMFAEKEAENAASGLNATFEGAILGA